MNNSPLKVYFNQVTDQLNLKLEYDASDKKCVLSVTRTDALGTNRLFTQALEAPFWLGVHNPIVDPIPTPGAPVGTTSIDFLSHHTGSGLIGDCRNSIRITAELEKLTIISLDPTVVKQQTIYVHGDFDKDGNFNLLLYDQATAKTTARNTG